MQNLRQFLAAFALWHRHIAGEPLARLLQLAGGGGLGGGGLVGGARLQVGDTGAERQPRPQQAPLASYNGST